MRERLRHGWRAAAFTLELVAGDRARWLTGARAPVAVTTHAVTHHDRVVRYECYAVPDRRGRRHPAIVVTHGFTHQGAADPRLQALCRRLARAGFVVVAPEFDEMRQYRLGTGDQADLEAVVAGLGAHPAIDAGRVGVMAFSFGAAPALIGLSRPPLRDAVTFAVVFGGYFDLKRTFKYVLTGAYDGFGHHGRLPVPTVGDDRWKFLRGNLAMIPPSPTSALLEDAAVRRIADPAALVDVSGCSEAERAAFALIENRDPDRFDALYDAAAPFIDAWVQRLSPVHTAHTIRARLILIHSYTDQKTPFIESIAMSRGVPAAPSPSLTLLNAFAHVDLRLNWRSLPSLLRDGLPGLVAVWRIVRDVMRAARL
jgi:dienelactone hydrolase